MSGRYYRRRYNNWYRGGRYYGNRRYYRRNTNSKAWGNMRAAKQQADQSNFTINIPTNISAFCRQENLLPDQGANGVKSMGCFALSIFDQLRKSEFFNNYANMYDEFKIDKVKVKLLPTSWSNLSGETRYRNLTVYTAWDRTGLNETQYEILCGKDFRTANNVPDPEYAGKNIWVIGSGSGTTYEQDGQQLTDYGGLYVTIGKDICSYSSAESRTVNINSNTSITRWLNPKTIQEKGQWISTASLKPWYLSYDMVRGRYYDLPVTDLKQLRVEEDYSADQIVTDGNWSARQINRSALSGLSSDNPCSLLEDNGIRFKPILLVSVYPEDQNTQSWPTGINNENITVPANLMQFNVETEVVCSFRGLRKSKVVSAYVKNNLFILYILYTYLNIFFVYLIIIYLFIYYN